VPIKSSLIDRSSRFFSGLNFSRSLVLAVAALLFAVSSATAQTLNVIYDFRSGNAGGPGFVIPSQGRDGELYGTTYGTGSYMGSIFKISTTGQPDLLAAFDGTNGTNPLGGVTLGSDGNFYGVALFGGSGNLGVLFRIAPTGAYTILHNFEGGSDGGEPVEPPIQASDGNFYGTTSQDSTVYKYSLSEGYSVIYQFDQTHGQEVIASLTEGTDGQLYGVADGGGANDCGTIFKLTKSGTPLWYYSFPCGDGGAGPITPLMQASDGSFYGTTQEQSGNGRNYGTLFKLGENGSVSTLYRFQGGDDGIEPLGLVQATDGNLYGVTQVGGSSGLGVFFTITNAGAYTVLQSFTSETGAYPSAAPLQDTNGMLYGTTQSDGTHNAGTAYSVDLGLGPFIALVGYISQPGRTVQILGQSLTGTTSLTFNGVPATSFNVVSDTFMTAVVPAGATTGPVVVTTPTGTLTSNKNLVITAP
jgi:uncharacterized repeat protein (TIGR03803 family)